MDARVMGRAWVSRTKWGDRVALRTVTQSHTRAGNGADASRICGGEPSTSTRSEPSCEGLVFVNDKRSGTTLMPKGLATSTRGFASMSGDRQREIASKGGRSVPAEKRSFSQDRELASEAGRKGGQASTGPRA